VRLVIYDTLSNHRTNHFPKMVSFCVWVRLYIDKDSAYLFLTRSIEKSRELLSTLKVFDSDAANDNYSIQR